MGPAVNSMHQTPSVLSVWCIGVLACCLSFVFRHSCQQGLFAGVVPLVLLLLLHRFLKCISHMKYQLQNTAAP